MNLSDPTTAAVVRAAASTAAFILILAGSLLMTWSLFKIVEYWLENTATGKYFSYIVRHKYFVFVAGRELGVPLWQLLVHDLSKFRPREFIPYRDWFYGEEPKFWRDKLTAASESNMFETKAYAKSYLEPWQQRFDRAWLAHLHANPHHWQHYILRLGDGTVKILEMPRNYMLEMLADWAGAGRATTGDWKGLRTWYLKQSQKGSTSLHPNTRKLVEQWIYFKKKP